MKIVGCDLHTHYQQIAILDAETGKLASAGWRGFSLGEARPFKIPILIVAKSATVRMGYPRSKGGPTPDAGRRQGQPLTQIKTQLRVSRTSKLFLLNPCGRDWHL
jgi:hypothetical protein